MLSPGPSGDPLEDRLAVPAVAPACRAPTGPAPRRRAIRLPLPRRLSTRPRPRSSSYAATTVARLTAIAVASARSAGSAVPATSCPCRPARRSRRPAGGTARRAPVSQSPSSVRQPARIPERSTSVSIGSGGLLPAPPGYPVAVQSVPDHRELIGIRTGSSPSSSPRSCWSGCRGRTSSTSALRSLTQGRRAGLVSALGVETGTLVTHPGRTRPGRRRRRVTGRLHRDHLRRRGVPGAARRADPAGPWARRRRRGR